MKKLLSLGLLLTASAASAQLTPPIGIQPPPLSTTPYVFDTAEQHGIKVSVIVQGIGRGFGVAFLPDGDLLFSERGGNLRIIHNPTSDHPVLDPDPVPGMPEREGSGLHDIALHPDFTDNNLVYFTWLGDAPDGPLIDGVTGRVHLQVRRGKLENGRLSDVETVYGITDPTVEGSWPTASRLTFGADGKIYVTSGAAFDEQSQDLGSIYGKVLRLNDDGSIPADNPFVGRAGADPAVYSYGHRDQHGLTVHPLTGQVFTAEHGPNGGDEANLIKPGGNYGWPTYTYGRDYDGSEISALPLAPGIEKPVVVWIPSIAPTSMMFYEGDRFPDWKGNLFVTSARRGEVNGTGGIERVVFNDELGELRRESLLGQFGRRVRNMLEGPDGNIYVFTEGEDASLLRIEPSAE